MKRVHWREYLQQNPAVDAVAQAPGGGSDRFLAFFGGVPRFDAKRCEWVGAMEVHSLLSEGVILTGLDDVGGVVWSLKTQKDAALAV